MVILIVITFVLVFNNGFLINYGISWTNKPATITYPTAFTAVGKVVANIIHGAAGHSNISVETFTLTYFTTWAFNEGNTFTGERFMWIAVGY